MTPNEKRRAGFLLAALRSMTTDDNRLRVVAAYERDAERRALLSLARWANKFRTPENATPCVQCGEAWDHRYNQGVNDVASECKRRAKGKT